MRAFRLWERVKTGRACGGKVMQQMILRAQK